MVQCAIQISRTPIFPVGGPHRLAVLRSEFPKALQSREFQLANIQTSSSPCQMSICQEIWSLGGSHTVKNHVATITKNLQPISDTFTSSHVKSSILWNKMVSLQN